MKVFVDKTLYTIDAPYFEESALDPNNAGMDFKVVQVIEGTIKSGKILEPSIKILEDNTSIEYYTFYKNKIYTINTAVKVEIPPGYVGLVGLRSSGMQGGFKVPAMGAVDPSYRGFVYCTTTYADVLVTAGEKLSANNEPFIKYYEDIPSIIVERYTRIHQLLVVPYYKFIELVDSAEELSTTARGEAGHGEHTGTNVKL
jgi:dUTPase